MDIGQRLKQARLEAGLSQRQLCGEEITRNMLSQIENGSARPSMDTLRFLAAQLNKPISYFLEEETVTSPNQALMAQAKAAFAQKDPVLEILKNYQSPDPVFDWEYHFIYALSAMDLARSVLAEGKPEYAWALLEEAADHGRQTPYYTPENETARLVLCYEARPQNARELAKQLPDFGKQILLLAQAQTDPLLRGRILDAFPDHDPRWHLLRADAWFQEGSYSKAIFHYEQAPQGKPVYERMEICYKELEDFKNAYFYAIKARE